MYWIKYRTFTLNFMLHYYWTNNTIILFPAIYGGLFTAREIYFIWKVQTIFFLLVIFTRRKKKFKHLFYPFHFNKENLFWTFQIKYISLAVKNEGSNYFMSSIPFLVSLNESSIRLFCTARPPTHNVLNDLPPRERKQVADIVLYNSLYERL